jgi:hypothetical protein
MKNALREMGRLLPHHWNGIGCWVFCACNEDESPKGTAWRRLLLIAKDEQSRAEEKQQEKQEKQHTTRPRRRLLLTLQHSPWGVVSSRGTL